MRRIKEFLTEFMWWIVFTMLAIALVGVAYDEGLLLWFKRVLTKGEIE